MTNIMLEKHETCIKCGAQFNQIEYDLQRHHCPTDMINRVAQALANVDANHEIYHQRPYMEWARAAIKAMQEPSVDMCMVHERKSWEDWTAYDLWQAMNDAALRN